MRSILIVCSRPIDDDPVVSFAADLAARTGAATSLAVAEEASPERIFEQACESDADLIVLSPRIPSGSTALELDRAATRIVHRCEPAVLVLRPPVREIRRILVPVRSDDLRRGSLALALEWAERFGSVGGRADGGPDAGPVEVQVLHVARDPDEMYEDLPLLRDELDRLSASSPGSTEVRRFQCMRWGAPPHARISRWAARHEVDLVILRRHGPGAPPVSQDHAWFHALGVAGRPSLLLPLDDTAGTASRRTAVGLASGSGGPGPLHGRGEMVAGAGQGRD